MDLIGRPLPLLLVAGLVAFAAVLVAPDVGAAPTGETYWVAHMENCSPCQAVSPTGYETTLTFVNLAKAGLKHDVVITDSAGQKTTLTVAGQATANYQLANPIHGSAKQTGGVYKIEAPGSIIVSAFSPLQTSLSAESYQAVSTRVGGTEFVVTAGVSADVKMQGYLTILPTTASASVTITPTVATNGGVGVPALQAGVAYSTQVAVGAALHIQANGDLSGTTITSDEPIIVFGGHECAQVPSASRSYCDHLVEQIPPTSKGASTFPICTSGAIRAGASDMVRIYNLGAGTNTISIAPADVNGVTGFTLTGLGDYQEIEIDENTLVTGTANVQIAQYLAKPYASHQSGEPAMVMPLAPQNWAKVAAAAIPTGLTDHLLIAAPTGTTVTYQKNTITGWQQIASSPYSCAVAQIGDGYQEVTADSPIGVTALGLTNVESYWMPGNAQGMAGFAPVPQPDEATTDENLAVDIDVLANDFDIEDEQLFIAQTNPGANGQTSILNGEIRYTPDTGFFGNDQFTYVVEDASGIQIETNVDVLVRPVSAPPIANDDTAVTDEDNSIVIDVLQNDQLQSGSQLFVKSVAAPGSGTTTIANNKVVYNPNDDYNGQDCFTYVAENEYKVNDTAQVCVTVNPIADAPRASDLTVTLLEDDPQVTVDVLANTQDPDGDTVTIVAIGVPQNGVATMNPSRAFYQPNPDFCGQDNFNVQVEDSTGLRDTAQITVIVGCVNDKPSFTHEGNQSVEEDSGQTVIVWVNQTTNGPANEASQQATFDVSFVNPADAQLFTTNPSINSLGELTFEPAPNAVGVVNLYVVMNDNGGTENGGVELSDTVPLTIEITPVNDDPTYTALFSKLPMDPSDTSSLILEDSGPFYAQFATNVSPGGGPDESGQNLLWSVYVPPAQQHLLVADPDVTAEGYLQFEPAPDQFGVVEVHISLLDSQDGKTTVIVPITITPVNDKPSFTAGDDIEITVPNHLPPQTIDGWVTNISVGPDNEANQQALFTINIDPSKQPLFDALPQINAGGSLSFKASGIDFGSIEMEICMRDSDGTTTFDSLSAGCQIRNIWIKSVNDAPQYDAGDDVTVDEDAGLAYIPWATNISAGPADEGWQKVWFVLTIKDQSLFSQVPKILPNGTLVFKPAPDANGRTSISVELHDDGGKELGGSDATSGHILTIDIAPKNDAPQAYPDVYWLDEDTSLEVDAGLGVKSNDVDVDFGDLTKVLLDTPPRYGELELQKDGSFTYTPPPNFYGTDKWVYEIVDFAGASDKTVVSMKILPVDDAPIGQPDYYVMRPNVENHVKPDRSVLVNDIELDGEPIRAQLLAQPQHGELRFKDDGSFWYTPDPGYIGEDYFVYRAVDGGSSSPIGSNVHLRIGHNNHPVADFKVDAKFAIAGVPVKFADRSYDRDSDGFAPNEASNPASIPLVSWVWDFGAGNIVREQSPNFTFEQPGTYAVSLTVSDAEGAKDTMTKDVEVLDRALVDPEHAINNGPRVTAGADQYVLSGQGVTLTAKADRGEPDKVKWVQLTGPDVELVQGDGFEAKFNAPRVPIGEERIRLQFQVTFVDDGFESNRDFVSVYVTRHTGDARVVLGKDRAVTEGETVFLQAAALGFFDRSRVEITWQQSAGLAIGIDEKAGESISFIVPYGAAGQNIVLQATASDGIVTVSETMTLTVNGTASGSNNAQGAGNAQQSEVLDEPSVFSSPTAISLYVAGGVLAVAVAAVVALGIKRRG